MALGFLYSTSTLQVPFTSSSFAEVISKSSAPTANLTCSATLFFRSSKFRVGNCLCDLSRRRSSAHIRLNGRVSIGLFFGRDLRVVVALRGGFGPFCGETAAGPHCI